MCRVTLPIAVALAAALCGPAALSHAQIYRWEDAQGHRHYSSDPPPAGAKSLGTVDTSKPSAQAAAPEPEPEPAPAEEAPPAPPTAAKRAGDFTPRTFALGSSGFEVTVAIPADCTQRKSNGGDPHVVAIFDCGRPGEPHEGALAILLNPTTRFSSADVERVCRSQSDYQRVVATMLSDTVTLRESSCDSERHKLVMSGTYRQRRELPEMQLALIPTTEGLLGAGAMWRPGTRPGTVAALRIASQSASVPDPFLVWPRPGSGLLAELAASLDESKTRQARHQRQQADVATPIAFVFFVLGAIGAVTLFRIVTSGDLGERLRRPR